MKIDPVATTTAAPASARRRCADVPHNAWYAAATSDEVGRTPPARRVLGGRIVVYRTAAGEAVALEDRCEHRPVPLSSGRLEGDDIVAVGLAKDSPLTPALHAAMQSLMDSSAYQATLDRWGLGAGAIPKSEKLG